MFDFIILAFITVSRILFGIDEVALMTLTPLKIYLIVNIYHE